MTNVFFSLQPIKLEFIFSLVETFALLYVTVNVKLNLALCILFQTLKLTYKIKTDQHLLTPKLLLNPTLHHAPSASLALIPPSLRKTQD